MKHFKSLVVAGRSVLIAVVTSSLVSCGGGGGDTANQSPGMGTFSVDGTWSFDNLSGSTANNSGTSYLDATLNSVRVVTGHKGTAIEFDPSLTTSDAIVSLANRHLRFTDGHLSVAMWIKPNLVENSAIYHLFGTNFSFNVRLIDGKIAFLLRPAAGSSDDQELILQSSSIVQPGVWQHIAVTYDGLVAKVFFDGRLDSQVSLAHPVANLDDTSLYIGGLTPDTGFKFTFPGAIDEVYFGARTLSDSEVAAMYSATI